MNIEEKKLMGLRFKQCRMDQKLSQEGLADLLGMKRTNVANYEAGRVVPPGNVLLELSNIFGVSTDYLLGKEEKKSDWDSTLPDLTVKDEHDIAKDLEKMMGDLESNEALSFHGEPMDEETKEALRMSLESSMRFAKQLAKQKFTPKKYRQKD